MMIRSSVALVLCLGFAAPAEAKRPKPAPDSSSVAAAPPPVAPKPAPPSAPKPDKKRVTILDFTISGIDPKTIPALEALVASEISPHKGYDVASKDDMRRIATHQEDKHSAGCGQDDACMAELARKLDADFFIRGSFGLVGREYVLNVSLLDPKDLSHVSSAVETIDAIEDLPRAVTSAVQKIFKWAPGDVTAFGLPKGKKQSFAVLDLKPTGLSPEVAQNLTQVLSVEVKGIEGASVISKSDISAMLQLSAAKMQLGCVDDACMTEIGGALGVDWLIAGDAGKVGKIFLVNLRLINVRAGAVENRVTESFSGDEEQLMRAVRHAARGLIGLPRGGNGQMAVTVNQSSANVFIDDASAGVAPLKLVDLTAGLHRVRLARDGCYDWHGDVYVDPTETTSVWGELRERPRPWFQKWWVWTIAGAVVAGGTTAAIIATRPASKTSPVTAVFP